MNPNIYVVLNNGSYDSYTSKATHRCINCDEAVVVIMQRPKSCHSCGHSAPTDNKGGRLRAQVYTSMSSYNVELSNGSLTVLEDGNPVAGYAADTWKSFTRFEPVVVSTRSKADCADFSDVFTMRIN